MVAESKCSKFWDLEQEIDFFSIIPQSLNGLNCVPSKTLKFELTLPVNVALFENRVFADYQVRIWSLRWTLIQYDWCLYKKGNLGIETDKQQCHGSCPPPNSSLWLTRGSVSGFRINKILTRWMFVHLSQPGQPSSWWPAVLLFCVFCLVPAETLICSLAGWLMVSLCSTLIEAVAFDPDFLGL